MTDHRQAEQEIAADLATVDLILALGTKAAKRKALAHRKACMAQIAAWNAEDGADSLTDAELLAELAA